MASLANNYTIFSQYLSLVPTSQPNYVALISGSTQGCTANGCPTITAPNLVDRFESAGLSWKGYFENMTRPEGCDYNVIDPYVPFHNPFIWFQDISNNTARCNKLVLANPDACTIIDCALVNDLNNATLPAPNFMWLTPNDCDNMRGSSDCNTTALIPPGNAYLSKLVPLIMNSRTFTTSRSALFITFDEGDAFCPGPYPMNEDCVYTSWSGPVAKRGFTSGTLYNHYSFPRTIEANWNLTSFTPNDANASPMRESFKTQSPDFELTATPPILTFKTGTVSNTTINIYSLSNYTGQVAVSPTSSPQGLTLTLNPTTVNVPRGGFATSTLTITSNQAGTYKVTVTGSTGPTIHNTTITVSLFSPDFAISAPVSVTLGQPTSNASSPVAISSTGDRTYFESSYLGSAFYAKGLYWLFYEDSRNSCEHQLGCLTYTSSANGSRWKAPTSVPVHVTDSSFSVYTNSTSIFYARYNETTFESSCGRKIQFGLGDLNTNGSVAWLPEQTVAQGAPDRDYPNDNILVDNTGQVWIGYMMASKGECGGNGTDRPQIIHSQGTNYTVWTGNTTLSTAHSDNWHVAIVPLGNGQVYASYWIYNHDLHGRLYNGTSWGPDEQISTTNGLNDVNAWLFNSGTSVYAVYFDNRTETYNYASRTTGGTWTRSTIGTAETHSGNTAFSPNYYSLPDTASYDSTDNLVYLFYMNSTNHSIDQWKGSGTSWTKTSRMISTTSVPYADSISSFIQPSPVILGAVFYISGTSSPFAMNVATLSFSTNGSVGSITIGIASQSGFTGTIILSTSTNPTSGLNITCNPTSIAGGSGTSICNINSTVSGNYNVTIRGTSGALSHSTIVVVTAPAGPDFIISASAPAPVDSGQSSTSTVIVNSIFGFNAQVSLTLTVPSGLTCSPISPSSLTGSGAANTSCSAMLPGNYSLGVTGMSGTLSHSATGLFRFEDFDISNPITVFIAQLGTNTTSTIFLTSLNDYAGNVTLSAATTTLAGAGGSISGGGGGGHSLTMAAPADPPTVSFEPATVQVNTGGGHSTLTINLSPLAQAGDYILTVTAADGAVLHSLQLLVQATDFSLTPDTGTLNMLPGTNSTVDVKLQSINSFKGTIILSATVSPTGPSTTFNPTTIQLESFNSGGLLTIIVPSNISLGTYTLTIQATSGKLSHTASITINVQIGFTSRSARIFETNTTLGLSLLAIVSLAVILPVLGARQQPRPRSRPQRFQAGPPSQPNHPLQNSLLVPRR
jgi:hypothetical protein